MRALFKLLLFAVFSIVVTRLAALVVSKRFDEGSEVSDEFRRVVALNGLDFSSRAGGLRSAEIVVVMGGAKVDLRGAVIDPAGARLRVESTMAGVVVLVRDDWAVTVDETLVGGGENKVAVRPPQDLPEDAPRVTIEVITRMGATVVSSDDADL